MVRSPQQRPPDSELRHSQLLTTFGPGAMVDLPHQSVIIAGLTYWKGEKQYIQEERLRTKIMRSFDLGPGQDLQLYAPPIQTSDANSSRSGIDAFVFPTWFLAQVDQTMTFNGKVYRTRPLIPWSQVKAGYRFNGKKVPCVPVRFVQACPNGHLSDLDWYAFAHQNSQLRCGRQLWLDEAGSGNDFEEIFVRCDCDSRYRRPLSQAKVKDSKVLGPCQGHRPWLGPHGREECQRFNPNPTPAEANPERPEYNRLLVRSASNAYFSQLISVISIPDPDTELQQAIDLFYTDDLQYAEDLDDISKELRKPKFQALSRFGAEVVWQEVQRRKTGTVAPADKKIKLVELEALLNCPDERARTEPSNAIFDAVIRDPKQLDPRFTDYIDQVVLVHRLREVIALIGFTRFEATPTRIDGEIDDDLAIGVRRANLDFEPNWIPAIENLGEGVFISFKTPAIEAWLARPAVKNRTQKLYQSYVKWADARGISRDHLNFPGAPYILLHSLSHLLITAVALDCGYTSSAIRERIYVFPGLGYGILLHTGTSGSEGTLGGLVNVGRQIESHLLRAIASGRLCSNDPVCAQHEPANPQEDRFLHGAACHGCLLIGETSCEQRNEFLDRALVVNTVDNLGAAFFPDSLT